MSFTDEEIAYIKSQPLARIATVAPDGRPDVAAVGFEFDNTHFYIGGFNPTNTRRSRNVRNGNHHVALVIDDVKSIQPWTPRFIRIYGTAELVDRAGQQILKITPTTSWSGNLSGRWSPGNVKKTLSAKPTTSRASSEAMNHNACPPRWSRSALPELASLGYSSMLMKCCHVAV
jgi:pyridoxamine 5'-phosphate oxidase family protein